MTKHDDIKISVVIPAYNSGAYIDETLQSVLNQTVKPFEIIVVDDGSKDNTREVVAKYNNIKLIAKNNEGPSRTRNRGIEESQGNWIAFLDSDDIWHPEKLEKTLQFLDKNPEYNMFSTALAVGNQKGWDKLYLRKPYTPNESFFSQLYRRSFIATSSVVIKKELIVKHGGFNSNLLVAEDLDLWLRISLDPQTKYHYITEHLLNYRSHSNSITHDPLNSAQDIEYVFDKFKHQAGFKLYLKRVIIWSLTTAMALKGQRRYFDVAKTIFSLGFFLVLSPFTFNFSKNPKAIFLKA